MLKDFKTEIKLFVRVVLIAVVVAVGGILLLKAIQPSPVVEISPLAPSPQPQVTNNQPFDSTPGEQSAIDASGWQTYRSDEFGFEVRHPAEWLVYVISQESDKINLEISYTPSPSPLAAEVQDGVLINLLHTKKQETLGELPEELEDLFVSDFPEVSFSAGIFECRRIAEEEPTPDGTALLCYSPYQKVEHITTAWSMMRNPARESQVQQILSTFRFVE